MNEMLKKSNITMMPMEPAEMILPEGGQLPAALEQIREMAGMIRSLADMLRITNERMAAMEKTIRTLEKVTPQQAHNINKAIRERAAELCGDYRMEGSEKPVCAAMRKEIREATGTKSMAGIARCDYESVINMVMDWDSYETMKQIRKKSRRTDGEKGAGPDGQPGKAEAVR